MAMKFPAQLMLFLAGVSAGANAQRVIYADKPVSAIRGVVVDTQATPLPIAEVKVQLYDHPETLKGTKSESGRPSEAVPSEVRSKLQHRLAEVQTDARGAFEINDVAPG